MGLGKRMIDDDANAERLNRGREEMYYGEEWPSEQECLDDEQRFYFSEPEQSGSQASDNG